MNNEQTKSFEIKIRVCTAVALTFLLIGCESATSELAKINSNNQNIEASVNQAGTSRDDSATGQLAIKAEPTAPISEGNYRIVTGDSLRLSVFAPNAVAIDLLYQPVTASDRAIRLASLTAPGEQKENLFVKELNVPPDFNGAVWARVRYPNGETKETERLQLTARSDSNTGSDTAANAGNVNQNSMQGDESARADSVTGEKIERAEAKPNNPNVRITVNVPAFLLTLWQDGREVATYPVGVGRKAFPIPIGLRSADQIILNPNWIPPNSEWVRESGIEPYQKIPASDPDNPLGKIKIPLGDAYLIHEAQSPADLGNLVSHGCIRVLREDIFDLTEKIVRARSLDISGKEIAAARKDTERRVIYLKGEIPVDVNYDTIVVENKMLHIYPDVYERETNTVEKLRAELAANGVDAANIDEKTLKEMLGKVSSEQQFVVSLADIKAGSALTAGKTAPLT